MSFWVIGVASRFVRCRQQLVVVVSGNDDTAPVWNSNDRWRFTFEFSGFYSNANKGWDESSVVHRTPTDWIKLFTLPIAD